MTPVGYEYGFVTASLSQGRGGRRRGLSAAEIGMALAEFSAGLAPSLRAMDGGGWEAVSHHLFKEGDAVIVTVMIRRAERPGLDA